jgi:hypothetical protein
MMGRQAAPASRPLSLREPRPVSARRGFSFVGTERSKQNAVEAAVIGRNEMKASALLAIGLAWVSVTVTFASSATASEQLAGPAQAPTQEQAVDCSKERWPNFSPSCLRNANLTGPVRLVTATRR